MVKEVLMLYFLGTIPLFFWRKWGNPWKPQSGQHYGASKYEPGVPTTVPQYLGYHMDKLPYQSYRLWHRCSV